MNVAQNFHYRFLLLTCMVMVFSVLMAMPAWATITLDGAVSSTTADDVSSVDVLHTTGTGTNRLMLVGVSWNSNTAACTISSVTFTPNGGSAVSLNEVISQKHGSNYRYAAIYSLLDPPSGQAGTVTVTFSGGTVTAGIVVGVANFSGVDQTTPLGVTNSAYSSSNNTTVTVNLTGLNGDELVFDTIFLGGNPPAALTVGSGQTQQWGDNYIANTRGAASTEQATSSSVTMSWTAASSSMWVTAAAAINPAPVGPTHDLTMAVYPSESGTTDPSVGVHAYPENEDVTITATPNAGYQFDYWEGDVDDPNSATTIVTMDADQTVTAHFTQDEYMLTINIVGYGTVNKTPDQTTYHYGDMVTLEAVADAGWTFDGWSDDLSGGINPETIEITGNITITATFVEYVPVPLALDGAVSSATADGVSSISVTHTTGTGTDRLTLVGVSSNSYNSARTISSVTFTPDGGSAIAFTEVGTIENESGRLAAIYSLLNPPSGVSGTVTVTYSGAVNYGIIMGVANFEGVDQSDPLDDFASAVGTESSAINVDVPTDVGDFVFDTIFIGAATIPTLTADASQTGLWNATIDRAGGAGSYELASSSTTAMSWTASGGASAYYWAIGAVAINPVITSTIYDLTIAVDPSEGGTTDPTAGVHSYAEDAVVSITATPNAGYTFDQWSGDLTGSDNPASITMDGNKNVTANFVAEEYTLTVNVVGNGSVSKDPNQTTYHYNDAVELTATADPGWTFAGWSGDLVSTDNPDDITMTGNKTVTATFVPEYTLTVGNDGNGSVTLDPAGGTYANGTSVTLTPVPNPGYVFDSWTGADAGDILESGGVYTIVMDANKSITATFAEVTLYVDGAVSSGTADDVASMDITHTTGTGTNRLMLVGVSWNCGSTDRTISSITFTPEGESAIGLTEVITQLGYNTSNPRYSAIYSLLDPPSGQAGTVTVTFSGSVSNGIMAGAANFAGVNQTTPLGTPGGANDNSAEASVTLTGLNGDELVFDNVFLGAGSSSYTLTAGLDQTELWNPDYVANLRAAASTAQATGSSVTMSWTVSTGNYWAIAAVPINPALAGTTYDLTMAVDPTEGGTTDPSVGVHTYSEDEGVNIEAVPNAGYEFTSWTGDVTGSVNPTSITMDGDKSVTAHFTQIEYTLTINIVGNGSVSKDPNQTTYHYDDVVELTATADPGWVFIGWSDDLVSTDNPDDITMTGNKTVTATFVQAFTLTAGDDGNGSVTLDPAGGTYANGTTVTLMPVPNLGYVFDSWTGDDAGDIVESDGVYTIVMDGDKSVSATFSEVTLYVDGAVSSGTNHDVNTISISHTTGTGSNRLMLVAVSAHNYTTAFDIDEVTFTYGSTELGLTEVGTGTDGGRKSAIYQLLNPPSGQLGTVTVNFSVTITYSIVVGAANFAGVDQTTPLGTFNSATGSWSGSSASLDMTGLNGNELVFDNLFGGSSSSPTLTVGPGQSELWNVQGDENMSGGSSTEQATSSSVTMSWTSDVTSGVSILAAVPINPAPTGTTYDLTMAVDPTEGGTTDPEVGIVHTYNENTVVNITATPATGYSFDHWEGDVADVNSASTTVTMNGDKTVIANFTVASILGDVNSDKAVNSTDALIVLSCDAGLDASAYCPMNCGDVNDDGVVNSTDALIILSYDVGISVPYPVGQPGCPSSVTPCAGCNP